MPDMTPAEAAEHVARITGASTTTILVDGKPAKDSPRYRAIGNSMAVPVLRWIGERINLVEGIA